MGYYSDFEISFNKKDLIIKQQVDILDFLENDNALGVITDVIREEREKNSAYYADKLLPDEVNVYEKTWYDFSEDFIRLSKQFPYLKITVERSGEDRFDVERCYFFNGNFQSSQGEMVFEENKLW